ncbi:MAG: hypothetical protein Q8S84_01540 [bacterium]|nr:hypothetical protein [bacterium]MDP3380250.1 hypothetical protein [bacterium]
MYISIKSLVFILTVLVGSAGLNMKYSCSNISLSINIGIISFVNPNGGIDHITQFISLVISSPFANLISFVPNSCLNFLAFNSLSQIVVTK